MMLFSFYYLLLYSGCPKYLFLFCKLATVITEINKQEKNRFIYLKLVCLCVHIFGKFLASNQQRNERENMTEGVLALISAGKSARLLPFTELHRLSVETVSGV